MLEMADTRYAFPSWEEIEKECRSVSRKISESGFRPDIIVALSRGGLVPARIISDMLVVKDLVSVKVDHWGITASKDGVARLRYPVDIDLSGKRVLIVDDITDTGESLLLAVDWAREKGPKDLRTAVIYHIDHSKIVPDFYGGVIKHEGWVWVVWPWNFVEDMCNILPKEMDGSKSLPVMRAAFEKTHDARIGEGRFGEALEELRLRKLVRHNADGTWETLKKMNDNQ